MTELHLDVGPGDFHGRTIEERIAVVAIAGSRLGWALCSATLAPSAYRQMESLLIHRAAACLGAGPSVLLVRCLGREVNVYLEGNPDRQDASEFVFKRWDAESPADLSLYATVRIASVEP